MIVVLIRTLILYFLVVFIMRIMGKRQIGQLQPFELVIAIMVSDLASIPMQDTGIPLINGIIPIITLLILQILISVLQLKCEFFRTLFCGRPSILINKGKIEMNELRIQRFNLNDLMEELRLKGYYNIEDIEYAVLETSGQLSIIPKSSLSSVTRKDLNITKQQETLPVTLILDGKIEYNNLKIINKDKNWLLSKLKENNIYDSNEIVIAVLDSRDDFYLQKRR
ncbi:MAG: YetF domain-containing protein [Clostridiaceae bacterium]